MQLASLSFPDIDPVLIEIGPFAVRWYALAYIAGLILAWIYAARLVRRDDLWTGASPVSRSQIDDLIVWAAFGIIIGGRLGYVLFYNFGFYADNPLEILTVWRGGMSFHGGFLGITIAVILFAFRHRLPVMTLGDLAAAGAPIGLFFGRIANFINGELFGRVTDVSWAVEFPTGGGLPRHPSQIYEALLEGLVLFLVIRYLIVAKRALRRPGLIFGVFLAGYGLARIFAEFFRQPDVHLGYFWGFITMGMLLSLPMVIGGLAIILWARRKAETGAS
ncbi:MAG: prolipoprotein diacylglyceryl transferase [Fimbriimonadaceae bacterium]|nr:prolipoprotein diacylglyceryl transferase [Alphaproteobacteria bacterium]